MQIPADFELELVRLLDDMDNAYERSAGKVGFVCKGCSDNCCQTRFYHHTLVELLYLHAGLAALPLENQKKIRTRAALVNQATVATASPEEMVRMMCPLNDNGRCMLYAHRPMICRLHGIPHSFRRPDGRFLTGPGCDDYYVQCQQAAASLCLDRTPFYSAMASLERRLREQLQFRQRLKLTIAEMVFYEIY